MILEGILTTVGVDDAVNVAPMGPIVEPEMKSLVLRPFQTSTSFQNLKRSGVGVFHVTDDVELLARAAVGKLDPLPPMSRAKLVAGWILDDACRWYAIRVKSMDESQPRSRIEVDVVDMGRQRDFFGFNRAKHAVVEAAILATRLELLGVNEILKEYARLRPWVDKTGGPRERAAFEFLTQFVSAATPVGEMVDMTG